MSDNTRTEQVDREKDRQRHQDMMRLVEQLTPGTRQRIAHRLEVRVHEITGTEEPRDA